MHLRSVSRSLILLAIIAALSAHGVEITVSLHAPNGAPVHGTLTAAAVAGGDLHKNTQIPVDGSAKFTLANGTTWFVVAKAPGFLANEFTVSVAANDAKRAIDVSLWPAAHIVGRLPKKSNASKVVVSYQAVESSQPSPPAGKHDCDVRSHRVQCEIPADATVDFNLHAPGYASIFQWGVRAMVGQTRDLGELTFVPGASFVGRVVGPKADSRSPITVVLTPMFFRSTTKPLGARTNVLQRSTTAVNGFFQFEGVPAGQYEVTASAAQLVSDRVEVTVIGTAEATLTQPLVLAPPRRLDVHVSPALDPWGVPWTLELERMNEASNLRTSVKSTIAAGGEWTATALAPGRYRLQVRRLPQGSWFSETFDIERDEQHWVNLDLAVVRGQVRIGERPIKGYIWFGGDHGDISIPIPTNDKGVFRTRIPLPENATWRELDIVADDPPLRRVLHDVHLRHVPDTNEYEVDLALPARGIFGDVVDERGLPVKRASVYAFNGRLDEGNVEVLTDAAGGFGFDGLEPGDYSVRAMAGDRHSQTEHMMLNADERVHPLHLTLKAKNDVLGRMIGPAGPIVGGRVWAIPPDRAATAGAAVETDLEGKFTIAIAADQPYVVIAASSPGFGFRYQKVGLPIDAINLRMSPDAAAVRFECADEGKALEQGYLPVVIHGGSYLPLALVKAWSGEAPTDAHGAIIARIEPGDYTLCYARQVTVGGETVPQPAKCASGVATPGGALTLSIAYSD